jgi:DivIVA domain-containing protein
MKTGKGRSMELASTDIENKTFDVVRKGYDREQVALFLEKVGDAMSRTDERRKIAEVRAEQLEREFHDLKTRADSTIKETVAARVRLLDTKAGDAPAAGIKPSSTVLVNQARIEAQQIIEQANVRATAMQAEAEAVIEGALASSAKINQERSDLLGSTEAERTGLIAAATEQAAAIRDEATQVVEIARADAAGYAAEVRHKAEADADRMTIEARMRAREITANAELQRDDLVASIENSRTRLGEIDQRVTTSAPADALEPSDHGFDPSDELNQVTVDLRRDSDLEEPVPATRSSRTSRYKSRSANLPHLGDDAASVIGSLGSLRRKTERDADG